MKEKENGEPGKKARNLNLKLYEVEIAIHDLLSRGGLEAAQSLAEAGMLLRVDGFNAIGERINVMLADLRKSGTSSFAARLRGMTGDVDDWSTSHSKVNQLAEGSSNGFSVCTPPEKVAIGG